jgi:hypothetical protein
MLSTPELTSLLFLLCDSGPTPLVSPELHNLVLAGLQERIGVVKCGRLMGFVMELPLETYVIIGEIVLIFGNMLGLKRER